MTFYWTPGVKGFKKLGKNNTPTNLLVFSFIFIGRGRFSSCCWATKARHWITPEPQEMEGISTYNIYLTLICFSILFLDFLLLLFSAFLLCFICLKFCSTFSSFFHFFLLLLIISLGFNFFFFNFESLYHLSAILKVDATNQNTMTSNWNLMKSKDTSKLEMLVTS